MVYLTEFKTINEEGDEETWAGPDIWAKNINDAYFLLAFLEMHYVTIIGIRIETIEWN